ncbi:pitrilysin family protein [Prevotella sp. tf2-5]|uniref:M16 family metallopeptidase n=1 Tax=Prevotella sp. tf2-5 TaxID=1761889 RepID=UPI000B87E12E|nr:pitrilysin family protein [Prevotella sp. tf2-5]
MTKFNIHTLDNGLRVIHLPSTSQVVYCGIGVKAGSRHEKEGEEGVAHFCEHVTFKGTHRRSALQILNCLESVGGDLNAFTNKEDTVFYAAILKEHLPRAVDLLTDIVFNSVYPKQEVVHEVDVICDEIESYNDSPAELIYDEFENMLFKGHPLGHNILGTREKVKTFTSVHAQRFTNRYYRPENAIFFAYGDINFKRLVDLLKRKEMVRPLTDFPVPPPIIVVPKKNPSEHHHQAHVMLGTQTFAFNDPRRIPLYLLNNILGGPGMNARLNLSMREKNGLVYMVESSMANYSDTGVWSVYFGCDHQDVKRCLRLVHRELDRMMQHPLSERQLNAAKRQLKGQIAIACDNREQFALDFAKSFLHYDKERDIDTLLQQIDAVTSEQLLQTAQTFFVPEKLQMLIL